MLLVLSICLPVPPGPVTAQTLADRSEVVTGAEVRVISLERLQSARRLRQLSIPFGFVLALGRLRLDLGSAFASTELTRVDSTSHSVDHLTDTQVRGAYVFGQDAVVATLALNLPTGPRRASARDYAVLGAVSPNFLAFPTASYATFVAEIASTLNEALLLDYALKGAKTDDERLLYLGSALESLRGTFFRQAMFGEFEQRVHAEVDKGEPLSGEAITKIYGEILRRYHGEAQGVVKIDDVYATEWAYIPHFYNAFYVFQYATSISAGSLFAEGILEKRPGAREKYLKLISSGGSDYPYELVKAAGVDLASAAPYDAVSKRMNRIMDEMEAILAKRKPA